MRVLRSLAACALALLSIGIGVGAEPAEHGLRVQDRWRIGGPGGWDYLAMDPGARRLYVSRSNRVVVLDADTGKPVGEIEPTAGVHGIALAPALKRGFVSDGRADAVTVFDTATLARVREIELPAKVPDAIVFEPGTQRVFTLNSRGANATAIDAQSLQVVGTVALSGRPEFAVSDGGGRVFVNIADRSELAVIDAKSLRVVSSWKLADCPEPTGLALDVEHGRLFSTCQNRTMLVTDSHDGRRVAAVPIGAGPDGVVFDPGTGRAFTSNGEDGTLTVVHEDDPAHFSVVDTVATQKSARTLAFDAKTQRIFLAAAEFGPAPAPTAEQGRARPPMIENSFTILVVGR